MMMIRAASNGHEVGVNREMNGVVREDKLSNRC